MPELSRSSQALSFQFTSISSSRDVHDPILVSIGNGAGASGSVLELSIVETQQTSPDGRFEGAWRLEIASSFIAGLNAVSHPLKLPSEATAETCQTGLRVIYSTAAGGSICAKQRFSSSWAA